MPEYETRTYFDEQEQDDVKGFTVVAHSDSAGYRIAEKWLKEEGDDTWMTYWIPEAQLAQRVEDGACSPKAKLSDEQFAKVKELAGIAGQQGGDAATA